MSISENRIILMLLQKNIKTLNESQFEQFKHATKLCFVLSYGTLIPRIC